jgi:streptogramin lyase
MMAWLFTSRTSLRRPSRKCRRAPRRNRSLALEDLEGRRLPSSALHSIVTVPGLTTNIVSGPDGDLWIGVSPTFSWAAVDRISLDGQITPFALPSSLSGIDSLAVGPDGNVWFDSTATDATSGNPEVVVGNVTPAGQVTVFPPIVVPNGGIFTRTELVSGPGGDLWLGYTDWGISPSSPSLDQQSFIARVTTAGAVTVFTIPALGSKSATIQSVAAGADGNLWLEVSAEGSLWFANNATRALKIGRITADGAAKSYRLSVSGGQQLQYWMYIGHDDASMVVGPDGNLYVIALVLGQHREPITTVYRFSPSELG